MYVHVVLTVYLSKAKLSVDVVLTVYLSKAKLSVDVVLTVYLSKAKLSVDVRIHIVYLQHNELTHSTYKLTCVCLVIFN